MAGVKLHQGLATKLLGTFAVVSVMVTATMVSLATSRLSRSMGASVASKGEAMALSLASAVEQSPAEDVSLVQGAIDSSKVIAGVRYIYLLDGEGAVQAHTFSPSFPVGLEKVNAVALGEVSSAQRVKVDGQVRFGVGEQALRAIDIAAPIAGGALGVVHVGMDQNAIDGEVAQLRLAMILWGGLVAVLGMALGLAVVLIIIVRPVRELTSVSAEIMRTGDFTQSIAVHSRDEVGELAHTFGQMVTKTRENAVSLQTTVLRLNDAVQYLTMATAEQTQNISRQAAALQQTQVTAEEIKQVSTMAAERAELVLRVAERADAISAAGERAVQQSLKGFTDIRATSEQIAEKIAGLDAQTRQISDITQTVKDLADQSSMLALNAAIEAVRSGEHGKGFAVVAREIRSLADQSIRSTERVRDVLQAITGAVRSTVAITEKGAQRMEAGLVDVKASGENLRQLADIVRENSGVARQIVAAVGQQNSGIAQIFSAVSDLSKMMEVTVSRLDATTISVAAIKEESEKVAVISQNYRAS